MVMARIAEENCWRMALST